MSIAKRWIVALILLAGPAAAQTRVTLPTDKSLSAYVGATGQFRSVLLGQTRSLTMASWMAAFAPNEAFDFSALVGRACQELGLPDDGGWGYITCEDPNLSVTIDVGDASKRLGSVRVYEVGSGALVDTITASADGSRAQSVLSCDASVRDYRVELLDKGGAVLSMLAVDLGKWDTVAWYAWPGSFEPNYPSPIACDSYIPQYKTDYFGTAAGNPKQAPGAQTYAGQSAPACYSTACSDYTNDTSTQVNIPPPTTFADLSKRDLVLVSVDPTKYKFPDAATLNALSALVGSKTIRDTTSALTNAVFLPYSKGYGYWQVKLTGEATAVMGAGFERSRKGGGLGVVLSAVATLVSPKKDVLSAILAAGAADWLGNQANQQASKMKQGDVFAIGDIYMLNSTQTVAEARDLTPILQDVTFTLQPDIAPESGAGSVTVALAGAWTTPAPPGPTNGGTLSLASPGFSGIMSLPKGWKWTATGCITSPMGYVAVNQSVQFQTPLDSVTIPCTLTKLLKWSIVTTCPVSVGAHVRVLNGPQVVYEGDSTQQNGKFVYTITQPISPGTYTVQASSSVSGYPRPTTYSGTVLVTVNPALALETTVTLTKQ